LEEYTKGIDLLTVNEENRLRKKVEELTIGTSDISILKQRVATHKKAIALTNWNNKWLRCIDGWSGYLGKCEQLTSMKKMREVMP
jgi:hypothetical protein